MTVSRTERKLSQDSHSATVPRYLSNLRFLFLQDKSKMAAALLPELIWTFFSIVLYVIEAICLAFIPNRFRTKKNISKEIVLVTGAGHGIGRSLAHKFAQEGCVVVLWDINAIWLQEARESLASSGATVHAYVCDVSDKTAVYRCAALVQAEVGEVGILVNNAGIVRAKYLLELPDEDILKVFGTNAYAHFWVRQA